MDQPSLTPEILTCTPASSLSAAMMEGTAVPGVRDS